MTMRRPTFIRPRRAALVAVTAWACLCAVAAAAAERPAAPDAQRRYQRETALCMKMRTDHSDCLSEASTRLASTLPSRADEAPELLAANALRRCEPLAEPDRSDCVARIRGQGTTTGSVAAGGIYRELVTREVGVPPAAAALATPAK